MRFHLGLPAALSLAAACLFLPGPASAVPAPGTTRAPGPATVRAVSHRVPTPGTGSELLSVACTSARRCWAAGDYQNTNTDTTRHQLLRWNGQRWRLVTLPRLHRQSSLTSVSCASARNCLAVGAVLDRSGNSARAEVLRWNGTNWSVAPGPAGFDSLTAVACTPTGDCWAVGSQNGPGAAVRWNGHGWGAPVTFSAFKAPAAITCVTDSDCWLAGDYVKPNSINLGNLVMHWNGRAWSGARVPQPTSGNQLAAITCTSPGDCWAAGSDTTPAGRSRNEALHWNGRRWALAVTLKGLRVNSELLGISCHARQDCWAAGDDEGGTEAMHWNGYRWALVPTPYRDRTGFLLAIDCLARTDCLAVGFHGLPPTVNLALHWDGSDWAKT